MKVTESSIANADEFIIMVFTETNERKNTGTAVNDLYAKYPDLRKEVKYWLKNHDEQVISFGDHWHQYLVINPDDDTIDSVMDAIEDAIGGTDFDDVADAQDEKFDGNFKAKIAIHIPKIYSALVPRLFAYENSARKSYVEFNIYIG